MKVTIFGADGRTGVEVVRYAKMRGLDVVAFVFSPNSNKYFPSGVEIKVGNVIDYTSVIDAIRGSDAVISALGHIKGSDPLMQTKGMINITKAMTELDVKRVLSMTGTGAREKTDHPSVIDSVLNFFVKLIDPDRINDGIEHVNVLKNSNLDWTLVRVLKLSNSVDEVSDYKLSDGGPAELHTSRKKVAKVLVDLIDDEKYIGKLPVISG